MSNTKLTLSLDKAIIEAAKKYAKEKKISLSQLIESYLQRITADQYPPIEPTPIVDELSGIISLPNDFDLKEDYADYLNEKYK